MDGADVPARPDRARGRRPSQARQRARRARWRHEGREATGCRFSLLDGARIVPGLSWHQGDSEDARGKARQQVKDAGLIPEATVRRWGRGEGAAWLGKPGQALFPPARPVLDDSHCAPYLHKRAKAQYGQTVQALAWGEAPLTR